MSHRERTLVPEAEFRSYYERPILKPPVWKVPDVPLYLFLGGMAGVSASAGALAELTGRPGLARSSRYVAAGAAVASVGALVHDLGRPERFLHMLRVFKPTSPLSVGSWILAPFSGLVVLAAVSDATGRLRWPGRAAEAVSAGLGPAMATYTAVLLADTAVPAWHEYHRELPFVFAGSALATAGGAGLLFAPPAERGPSRALVALGAGLEQAAVARVERSPALVAEPYRTGRSRTLLRAAKALTVGGAVLVAAGRRSRVLTALGGAAVLAAGLATRFGVFYAGQESARDPKYTVVPQRARLRST